MILNGIKLADTGEPVSIRIADKKIDAVSASPIRDENAKALNFDNAIVFPGLINSHDHLDFNLFPQLRNGIYNNYTEWGKDIHQTFKNEIADVLKIPLLLRLEWGLYKNLLCGVTTVVSHGERISLSNPIITVFEDSQCLHSVHFEKAWQLKLNNPFKAAVPVNMHVGEGNDWLAFSEIEQLKRWNLLGRKLVGVHAVAMSENQVKKFKAIVWCPDSNYFLLNKTAHINVLSRHTTVLFGTDSTLTASWNIWEHLRLARKTQLLSDDALYKTLNANAAKIWKLDTGEIAIGKDADIVVAKTKPGTSGLGAFFNISPADLLLVMHKGTISLFDDTLLPQLNDTVSEGFSKICFGSACKHVRGDLPGLVKKVRQYSPEAQFPVGLEYIVPSYETFKI